MKLDSVRLPKMGLPSCGTEVTAHSPGGDVIADDAQLVEGIKGGVVTLYPAETCHALLTASDGKRFERRVIGIVVAGGS